MSALGVINQAPQTADAAYGQQAHSASTQEGLESQRNAQLYNGYGTVQGSSEQIRNSEGAQGNLYSGGSKMAQDANTQNYSFSQGMLKRGLQTTLSNLALTRFLNSTGQSGG